MLAAAAGLSLAPALAGAGVGADEQAAAEAYDAGEIDTALAIWRLAARAGSVDAAMAVAALVEPGGEGPQDRAEALRCYRFAAAAGDPVAMTRLASLLAVAAPEAARGWLEMAAARGHPPALLRLGRPGPGRAGDDRRDGPVETH